MLKTYSFSLIALMKLTYYKRLYNNIPLWRIYIFMIVHFYREFLLHQLQLLLQRTAILL